MSYIQKNLLLNETLIYCAKPHWIIFSVPILCTIAGIICLFLPNFLVVLAYVFLLAAVITWINAVITYLTSEFGLTDKRVLIKIGFIRRYSLELLLQRVESIQVDQSILGRLFSYGTIILCGTGGSKDPFYQIADPLTFRRKVQEQLEKLLTVNYH